MSIRVIVVVETMSFIGLAVWWAVMRESLTYQVAVGMIYLGFQVHYIKYLIRRAVQLRHSLFAVGRKIDRIIGNHAGAAPHQDTPTLPEDQRDRVVGGYQ